MTSTTVYLTEEQQERLSDVSARLRVPKAVLIREGIELALAERGATPDLATAQHGAPPDCAEGLREGVAAPSDWEVPPCPQ